MTFENIEVAGIENAMRGMRNPMSGWGKSDTKGFTIGMTDLDLAKRLIKAGEPHRKFMRQIFVSVDIVKAPTYWLRELDTYKVGTTLDSSSTMHKLTSRPLSENDFERPEVGIERICLGDIISIINHLREEYIAKKRNGDGDAELYFRAMKRLLPSGYLYERVTWTANYEVLHNIWKWRHNHRLPAWHTFCNEFIGDLPYAEFITEEIA